MNEEQQTTFYLQVLAVMVCDLGYDLDIPPRYGHYAIRHNLMWSHLQKFFGKVFESHVESFMKQRSEEGKQRADMK